jgi:hypothetical protein
MQRLLPIQYYDRISLGQGKLENARLAIGRAATNVGVRHECCAFSLSFHDYGSQQSSQPISKTGNDVDQIEWVMDLI